MANVSRNHTIEVLTAKYSSASSITVTATLVDKVKQTYTASSVYADGADTVTAQVCSPNGKPKVFANLDDIQKAFAKGAPGVATIAITANVDLLSPDRVSLNPAAQLAADKIKNKAALDRQTAVVAKIDTTLAAIAAYQTGNSLQQSAYNKLAAERAIANELKVYLAALPQP